MWGHPIAPKGEHFHDQSQPPDQVAELCHVPVEFINADTAFEFVLRAVHAEAEHPLKEPYTEVLLPTFSITSVASDAKLATSVEDK